VWIFIFKGKYLYIHPRRKYTVNRRHEQFGENSNLNMHTVCMITAIYLVRWLWKRMVFMVNNRRKYWGILSTRGNEISKLSWPVMFCNFVVSFSSGYHLLMLFTDLPYSLKKEIRLVSVLSAFENVTSFAFVSVPDFKYLHSTDFRLNYVYTTSSL